MIVNMVAPWGTKYHYMSGIHTNVTTVQLLSGQAWYSYLWDSPKTGEMTPLIVYRCRLQSQFRLEGRRDRVNGCNGDFATNHRSVYDCCGTNAQCTRPP